ncbi:hypothetical protein [Bradyrhizobium sp. Ghvi]|uniref:hypothetical protein n=1 Tax=Bradyrhizobium sp. Ghvi TaxID=1855319 RepID=UPI0015A5D4FC|nr:hypothetical protein [Bradyrhizobium sp. Ghvi]
MKLLEPPFLRRPFGQVWDEAGEEPFGAHFGLCDGGRAVARFADHDTADADDVLLAVGQIT